MAIDIPHNEPAAITAGDLVEWRVQDGERPPSDGWALSYELINASGKISIGSIAGAGGEWTVSIPAATTAGWSAGVYQWSRILTLGAARHVALTGRVHVLLNPATASSAETRSFAEQMRDALRAVLLGKASVDQQAYTLQGTSVSRYSPEELQRWLTHYEHMVAREQRRAAALAGRPVGGSVRVRF